MLDNLFKPFKIGNCEIPNRLVVPAMVTNYCNPDGTITERYIRYMEEKARGGWGLIITEDYCVEPNGKGYSRIPGLYNDEQIEGSRRLCEAVHAQGSKFFCQMYHPGRQTTPIANNNTTPYAPVNDKDPMCRFQAHEMSIEEIHQLVAAFGAAAGRAKKAGFDGIELHCAHGYLLAEFLSPSANRRVDEYGGCFDNRVRIVDEIMMRLVPTSQSKCVFLAMILFQVAEPLPRRLSLLVTWKKLALRPLTAQMVCMRQKRLTKLLPLCLLSMHLIWIVLIAFAR